MRAIPPPLALCGALAALVACGPAPAPDAPATGATSSPASAPTAGATSPPAVEAPSVTPDAPPSAKVTEVKGEPGKAAYMKVTAIFTNPNARACRISRYTLEWPGGSKEIPLDDFVIPAKENRQRSVKVHPSDGDLTKLSVDGARMTLPEKCDAP